MITIYHYLGMVAFWGIAGFALLFMACLFLRTQASIKLFGFLNFWVFQWIFIRITWERYKFSDKAHAWGILFTAPKSGYNDRPYSTWHRYVRLLRP